MKTLESSKNPQILKLKKLRNSSHRAKLGMFLVEGEREIFQLLQKKRFSIDSWFFCPDYSPDHQLLQELQSRSSQGFQLSCGLWDSVALRQEGVIAIVKTPKPSDPDLISSSLILVLESIEKPGNLGAMVRTACAFGIQDIVLVNPKVDVYNPNVIRASLGGVFSQNFFVFSPERWWVWAKEKGVHCYVAHQNELSHNHQELAYSRPAALVLGSEAFGVSPGMQKSTLIQIPMETSCVDSLNVSVAMGILLWEIQSQWRA